MASRTRQSARQSKSPSPGLGKRKRPQHSRWVGSARGEGPGVERMQWRQTVAAFDKTSITSLIEQHREWKKSGANHDPYCRVCHRTGRLEQCKTCSLSFHSTCMPSGWIRDSIHQWFCPLCVRNKWHISPPECTPPASPKLTPVEEEIQSTVPPTSKQPDHNVQSASPQISTSTPRSPQDHRDNKVKSQHGRQQPLSVHNTPEILHERNLPQGSSQPPNPQPSPLSAQAEASMSFIYHELSTIPILRDQIEGLRAENARYVQMLHMRDQGLEELRRHLDSQVSAQELERLKANTLELDRVTVELRELRQKYTSLERELQSSKDESTRATQTMNEWKNKLTQLISP